ERVAIARFLDEHPIRVLEVVNGADLPEPHRTEYLKRLGAIMRTPPGANAARALVKLRKDFNVAIDGSPIGSETKFAASVVHGGTRYRELLLVLGSERPVVPHFYNIYVGKEPVEEGIHR